MLLSSFFSIKVISAQISYEKNNVVKGETSCVFFLLWRYKCFRYQTGREFTYFDVREQMFVSAKNTYKEYSYSNWNYGRY